MLLFCSSAIASDILPPKSDVSGPKAEYSPYADDYFPNQVYFGDTHLHSSWSTDADRTSQVIPYSQYDSVDPEDLWDYLSNYEKKTGGQVLAIPHNGNLSNGLMIDVETMDKGNLNGSAAKTDELPFLMAGPLMPMAVAEHRLVTR